MIVIEQENSKTGQPILRMNQLYVHSKYDPIKEAERIINQHFKKNHTHIIFGYGEGYLVDKLLSKCKAEKIIVIDPLVKSEKLIIKEKHQNNIMYWDEQNENTLEYIMQELGNQLDLKIQIIVTPNYDRLFIDQYAQLLKRIRNFQSKSIIGTTTEILFADRWQKNVTFNLKNLIRDKSLMELTEQFKLPVVVASGGPSLTKQLPLLKKIEDSVIIIAAGSTINSLLAANIEPDFVVSIDGGEPNYNHFKDVKTKKTRLVYATFNHYKIRDVFRNQAYAFIGLNEKALQSYVSRKLGKLFPRLSGGGTVAHYAYSVAHTMNSGPIAFIGQDLAYTNGETHAQNNKHYKKVENDMELLEVEGYYDEPILTSRIFLSMKTTFEEMVRFHEVTQLNFNCTEGGVKIKGMYQLPFAEFINQYVDKTVKKDFTDIDNAPKDDVSVDKLITVLEEELAIIDDLSKKCEQALKILKNNSSNKQFSQKTLIKLSKIDKILEKKTKEIQIHYLIKPIYVEVERLYLPKEHETAEETYSRVKKQSEALYSKLQKALDKSKENITELLVELKEELEDGTRIT